MDKVFVVLGIVAGVFGTVYVIVMSRHRERIAMIEKGASASMFSTKSNSYNTLKFGMLFVGIAVGLLLGNVLEDYYEMNDGVAYLSMIFLFGGISLIANFLLERNLVKNDGL